MNNEIKDDRRYNEWPEAAAQELADIFAAVSRLDASLNTIVCDAYKKESCGEDFEQARNSALLAKKSLDDCKRLLADAMS